MSRSGLSREEKTKLYNKIKQGVVYIKQTMSNRDLFGKVINKIVPGCVPGQGSVGDYFRIEQHSQRGLGISSSSIRPDGAEIVEDVTALEVIKFMNPKESKKGK